MALVSDDPDDPDDPDDQNACGCLNDIIGHALELIERYCHRPMLSAKR